MRYVLLSLLLLLIGNQHASAQIEGQFVRPDTVVTIGFLSFGSAVGMSGDIAVSAYSIPNFNTVWFMDNVAGLWEQVDEVEALQEDASQVFGSSVAIDGEAAVVGGLSYSYNGATNGGIAYVYELVDNAWVGTATLTPSDVEGQDEFGISVGVDGDVAIVGSHKADASGNDNAGAAYIFRKSGESWIEEDILLPSATDTVLTGRIGWSVDVSGDYAITGGPFELQGTSVVGSAYIYEYADTAWVQAVRLVPDQPTIIESFGSDVVINGDVAMVGASGADNGETVAGGVYVYNRIDEVWTLTQKIVSSDGEGSDQFGRNVDFEGNCAVVGAFNANKAYIFLFDGTTWQEEAILTPSMGESENGFGFDVGVSDGNVIVGTQGIFIEGMGGGGVFLYDNLCERIATSNESEDPFNLSFDLHQNYPNPFSRNTTIQYNIEQPAYVQLSVYNLLGQEVARLKEGVQSVGTHLTTWDASELASGMYIYALHVDGVRVASKRMVVR